MSDPIGRTPCFTGSVDTADQLRALIIRHADPAAGIVRTALPGVSIMAAVAPTQPLVSVAQPSLAVVVQGAKRTVVNGQVHDYGAGQYLVVSLDLPVTAHITHADPVTPFLAFGLNLRPERIATLLFEAGARDAGAASTAPGIAVSAAPDPLLDAITRLLGLLDQPEDVGALAPAYEREILWRLIRGEQGATVRQIGRSDSHLSHIDRAVEWIRRHYDEPVRVEQLAALSSMSASAFHRHFRAATAMTPIQYQKQVRLQEARAQLIERPGEVAEVGFAVGYQSASQFSREYRRLFGVPPGRDAQRLRATATAA